MTPSDSRPGRRLTTPLRPLPSRRAGLPRLPASPFRRAVPITPADRAGACVDCFPARTAFPKWQEGRHPHCHAHSLLRLHSRYGPSDCSAALQRPLSRGSDPSGYPTKPLVSYQINRQLSGWKSSSTGDPRLRGALPLPDLPGFGFDFPTAISGSRPRGSDPARRRSVTENLFHGP